MEVLKYCLALAGPLVARTTWRAKSVKDPIMDRSGKVPCVL